MWKCTSPRSASEKIGYRHSPASEQRTRRIRSCQNPPGLLYYVAGEGLEGVIASLYRPSLFASDAILGAAAVCRTAKGPQDGCEARERRHLLYTGVNNKFILDYPQHLRPKGSSNRPIKKIQHGLVDSLRCFHHRELGDAAAPGTRLALIDCNNVRYYSFGDACAGESNRSKRALGGTRASL